MDANALAHEIHKRNMSMDGNAPRHKAAGIAAFCDTYGYEPTTDDFSSHLDLLIANFTERMILVSSDSPGWIVPGRVFDLFLAPDFFVFTSGSRLSETEVEGWLPWKRVNAAPSLTGGKGDKVVSIECIYPMPMVMDFESNFGFIEPELDVPGIWDYELQALWTPLGFHVYDDTIADMVASADREMGK